jgi:hypothetical protein
VTGRGLTIELHLMKSQSLPSFVHKRLHELAILSAPYLSLVVRTIPSARTDVLDKPVVCLSCSVDHALRCHQLHLGIACRGSIDQSGMLWKVHHARLAVVDPVAMQLIQRYNKTSAYLSQISLPAPSIDSAVSTRPHFEQETLLLRVTNFRLCR